MSLQMAVQKPKTGSAKELKEYYAQPASGMRIVGRLPSDAELEEARRRVRDGESKEEVLAELLDRNLFTEAEMFGRE